NYTGKVLAFVGGYEYKISDQFNRAYQAYRQPGSVFKIVVYTAALEKGFTPYTTVVDKVYTYTGADGKPYSPVNWDKKYWGSMPLIDAFAFSRNTVAVYLANIVGIDYVINTAYKMGVTTKLEPYLSTALGSSVITPLDVAILTSVVANYGYLINPQFINKVEDRYGGTLFISSINYKQVIPYQVAEDMRKLMKAVVDKGTGYSARLNGVSCYGKTGTTSDHRDAWFAGFTDDFTCVVWIGNDDYSPLYNVYGATLPAEIWKKSILTAYKYYTPSQKIKSDIIRNIQKSERKNETFNNEKSNEINRDSQNNSDQNKKSTPNPTTTLKTTTTVDYNTFPWENTDN
ncbi:MAG: transglycosylase domain-containing protein, partial [bacterium]